LISRRRASSVGRPFRQTCGPGPSTAPQAPPGRPRGRVTHPRPERGRPDPKLDPAADDWLLSRRPDRGRRLRSQSSAADNPAAGAAAVTTASDRTAPRQKTPDETREARGRIFGRAPSRRRPRGAAAAPHGGPSVAGPGDAKTTLVVSRKIREARNGGRRAADTDGKRRGTGGETPGAAEARGRIFHPNAESPRRRVAAMAPRRSSGGTTRALERRGQQISIG